MIQIMVLGQFALLDVRDSLTSLEQEQQRCFLTGAHRQKLPNELEGADAQILAHLAQIPNLGWYGTATVTVRYRTAATP